MAGNSASTKQVIIMREDLPMNVGKIAAQAAHASLATLLNKNKSHIREQINIDLNKEEIEWFNDKFTKILLGAKSEQQLLNLKDKALNLGLNVVEIVDAGHTTFDKPTLTCIGIGPNFKEDIDQVTKKLQLYKKTNREKRLEKYLISQIRYLEDDALTNIDKIKEIRNILRES